MPKIKTHKALAKKVKVTKSGKIFRRATGQNHFNAKDTGSETRDKRNDRRLASGDEKNVRKALAN